MLISFYIIFHSPLWITFRRQQTTRLLFTYSTDITTRVKVFQFCFVNYLIH